MKYSLLAVFGLASVAWGYIQYLLSQIRRREEQAARREVDEKIKKDNQAVADALAKVTTTDRDYSAVRDAYESEHKDDKK